MTKALTVQIGWIKPEYGNERTCTFQGKDDQRCSGHGRYRVIARGPLTDLNGHLCANHLAKHAATLGVDVSNIGPWKESMRPE